jgi:hypothetical protein
MQPEQAFLILFVLRTFFFLRNPVPLSCEFTRAYDGKLTVISCDPPLQMKMPVMTAYFQSAPASVQPHLPARQARASCQSVTSSVAKAS